MIKGDKIRLVKPMGAFTNIGEECEVLDITEDGVVSFRFCGINMGCMSFDEYEKYFELVEPEPPKPKREWSKWGMTWVNFIDNPYHGTIDSCCYIGAWYRDNGKKVQVKAKIYDKVLRAECTCHKSDTFSIEKGRKLALQRLSAKCTSYMAERYAKSL